MVRKVDTKLNIEEIKLALQEIADTMMAEENKKYEEEKKRLEKEAELKRQEYRASLKPVSKEEFMKRFVELSQKNAEWEKYRKDNGILFVSVDFEDIKKLMRNAKDELDYAEILEKTESRLNFFMNDVKKTIEEINASIDFDEIAKEMEKDRKMHLGFKKNPLRENIREEIAFSKEMKDNMRN